MKLPHTQSHITLETFNHLLSAYPDVCPSKLLDLDILRYDSIPTALAERKAKAQSGTPSSKPVALTKAELLSLVDWKLSHGQFRPSLKRLVDSNSEADVARCTAAGLSILNASSEDLIADALKPLTELKGVGPATASLILSASDPERAPFFSDECYRWLHWVGNPNQGWDRKINYTLKEYKSLLEKATWLKRRLGVRVVDIEKVAYVLGRRVAGKSAEDEKKDSKSVEVPSKRKAEEDAENLASNKAAKPPPKPKEETVKKTVRPSRGTRSSSRSKLNDT